MSNVLHRHPHFKRDMGRLHRHFMIMGALSSLAVAAAGIGSLWLYYGAMDGTDQAHNYTGNTLWFWLGIGFIVGGLIFFSIAISSYRALRYLAKTATPEPIRVRLWLEEDSESTKCWANIFDELGEETHKKRYIALLTGIPEKTHPGWGKELFTARLYRHPRYKRHMIIETPEELWHASCMVDCNDPRISKIAQQWLDRI